MTFAGGMAFHVPTLYVGSAGWAIPAAHADRFSREGSHLQRYAQVFNCVEINSSFYRPHQPATYSRWAITVPEDFRFAVKMPRAISHQARLRDCAPVLQTFLAQVSQLGEKLGCLLLQLPPSLAYQPSVALSCFESCVSHALAERGIARVAADPAMSPRAALPAGDPALQYLRLHGSPRMYYDSYSAAALQTIGLRLQRASRRTAQRWCIFDNTALGHATENALTLPGRDHG
jgi:uncharacterized protein YecE (DUF72 family)